MQGGGVDFNMNKPNNHKKHHQLVRSSVFSLLSCLITTDEEEALTACNKHAVIGSRPVVLFCFRQSTGHAALLCLVGTKEEEIYEKVSIRRHEMFGNVYLMARGYWVWVKFSESSKKRLFSSHTHTYIHTHCLPLSLSQTSPADRFILWWSFLCAPLRSCSGVSRIPCLAAAACDRLVIPRFAQMTLCPEPHCTSLQNLRRQRKKNLFHSLSFLVVFHIVCILVLCGWPSRCIMWYRWWGHNVIKCVLKHFTTLLLIHILFIIIINIRVYCN